jgi:hypothetical protein
VYTLDPIYYCIKWLYLCIAEKRSPSQYHLPVDYYYYTGNCSDAQTQAEIAETFIFIMHNRTALKFPGVCPDHLCTVDNVQVTCGPVSGRKRRRAAESGTRLSRERRALDDVTFVYFEIVTKLETTLDFIYAIIEEDVMAGEFDFDGLTVDQSSLFPGWPDGRCNVSQEVKYGPGGSIACSKPVSMVSVVTDTLCILSG